MNCSIFYIYWFVLFMNSSNISSNKVYSLVEIQLDRFGSWFHPSLSSHQEFGSWIVHFSRFELGSTDLHTSTRGIVLAKTHDWTIRATKTYSCINTNYIIQDTSACYCTNQAPNINVINLSMYSSISVLRICSNPYLNIYNHWEIIATYKNVCLHAISH